VYVYLVQSMSRRPNWLGWPPSHALDDQLSGQENSADARGPYTAETSVQIWLLAPSQPSGSVTALTAADPDQQPRDWAPKS